MSNLLTLAQAADRLGLSPATLRWQVNKGKLKAQKLGHIWFVTEAEIERYQREHRKQKA